MSDNNNTKTKIYKSHKDRPNEEIILEPFNYVMALKGKGIREKFAKGYNEWLRIPDNLFKILLEIGDMGHNASLLIDDIEDGSDLRRGKPTAHLVYGTPKTITSANYIYFLQQEKIANEFPSEHQESALKIVIDLMLEGHIGQGMDIYWRDKWICPTEKEYKKMVIQKTGAFFTGLLQLAHLLNPDKEKEKKIGKQLYRIAEVMTIFFQIRDDYANLVSKVYEKTKTFAEDITEGKFSFPAIHCIQSNPKDKRLLDILKMKTTDPQLKREAVRIMKQSGSLEYTRNTCKSLEQEFRDLVNQIRKIVGCGGDALLDIIDSYSLRNINTELEPNSGISTALSKSKVSGDSTTPAMAVPRNLDTKSIGGNFLVAPNRCSVNMAVRFFLQKAKKILRPRVKNAEEKRYRSHKKRPNEKIILEPFHYLMALKGKSIRDKFTVRYSDLLNIPEKFLKELWDMADMGHNACVMMDDIQDGSELRRGQPCAHLVYGVPATINAANYVYFLIQEKIANEFPPEHRKNALKIYVDRVLEAHIGQGMDIHYRENLICPTEEEYKEMVIHKNAAGFLPFQLGFLLNPDKELEKKVVKQFYQMVEASALFLQTRDDYANLVSKVYAEAKSFAEDIAEGKISFPVVHCIQSNPDDRRLINILKLRTTDPELKREAIRIMEESGSLEYTRKTCQALDEEVRCLLNEIYEIANQNVCEESLLRTMHVKKKALWKKDALRKKEPLFRKEALRMKKAMHEIIDAYTLDNINTDREPKGYIMQGPFSEEVINLQTKFHVNQSYGGVSLRSTV